MNLLELVFQRRKAHGEARRLLDTAVTEGRELSLQERIRFDSLMAQCKEFDAAIEARAALRTV